MQSIQSYQELINNELQKRLQQSTIQEPSGLYDPCKYILRNGGKRVRASLVLLAAKMFVSNYEKAIPVALAFETFHNFTLIHDDIMDDADIRRGQPTVHVKWDENTAILSGDAVMILAYTFFEEAREYVLDILPLLNKTALEVCEGQQYDIDLEKAALTDSITNETQYIRMIELKTSVLLAACLKAGAIVGGASAEDAQKLYEIGRKVGIAFQLQDDILDSYGNTETFGKKIGGDITENKKTYLVITALNNLNENDKQELIRLYAQKSDDIQKYVQVRALFDKAQVHEKTTNAMNTLFEEAHTILNSLSIADDKKRELHTFIEELRTRKN
ncbi:MAG: polyprenyl synthetase family protein [Bacteroidales bacterium]|jgi:geranylgeranyl diphosphate synthase type II|nr:polyprenyl synthetase family protein [Bacteroidales bacterium]